MKRKNYLLALALPALLAACSQEEFTTEANGNGNLKLVENPIQDFSLEVNVGDADTRVTNGMRWHIGDKIGLAWFNPNWYNEYGQIKPSDAPVFYANNQLSINAEATWTSDAVIMEGSHFAYFPFQTVWGDEYLQVKGGQEILKVYNAVDQEDVIGANRLNWMVNHQTLLSPAYKFTQEEGTAGISDSRRITLELFSNRLNILPKFVNGPSDLTVFGYTLQTQEEKNAYGVSEPFVTAAEIKANKLPGSAEFGGCNWATLNNTTVKLKDFYNPVEYTSALNVNYTEEVNGVPVAEAPKFTFLLLPALNAGNQANNGSGATAASVIELVAHTNYGDIPVNVVTGKFDANSTNEVEISLSKLYYGGENKDQVVSANTFVGFINNAGTTRGASEGVNGDITATFDFENIEYTLPPVCDNTTYNRALDMIKNYNEKLGETEFIITLCEQPQFRNLAFSAGIEAVEKELDVIINVTGIQWTDEEEVKHMSEITWYGNRNSIAERISNVEHFIAKNAVLTADVDNKGKLTAGLNETTVLKGGTLQNNRDAQKVNVEEGGVAYNNAIEGKDYVGYMNEVVNYGTMNNQPALTNLPDDQPRIATLYNYGLVNNYAAISRVAANNNAEYTEDGENTAKIVLLDNPNEYDSFVIGAIFSITDVEGYGYYVDADENNIEYTVDDTKAVGAGKELATALTQKATNIFVNDKVNIESTSYKVLNGEKFAARVTFLGKSTYTFASSAQFDNTLQLGEIVLAEKANLTVVNSLAANGGYNTLDVYALAADRTAMNNASQLNVGVGAKYATWVLAVVPNGAATVKTNIHKSSQFYGIPSTVGGKLTTEGNVNYIITDELKEHFGWE